MPHKVTTVALLDEVMTTAKVAGSCSAIRLGSGYALVALFDAHAPSMDGLAGRLRAHYPALKVLTGRQYQVGTDMLFKQISAYLEFFGFRAATSDELLDVARISY